MEHFTRFHQNPTHSNQDQEIKAAKVGHTDTHTDRQIKFGGAIVSQTGTINQIAIPQTDDKPNSYYLKYLSLQNDQHPQLSIESPYKPLFEVKYLVGCFELLEQEIQARSLLKERIPGQTNE